MGVSIVEAVGPTQNLTLAGKGARFEKTAMRAFRLH
jgi:hypothetical protein